MLILNQTSMKLTFLQKTKHAMQSTCVHVNRFVSYLHKSFRYLPTSVFNGWKALRKNAQSVLLNDFDMIVCDRYWILHIQKLCSYMSISADSGTHQWCLTKHCEWITCWKKMRSATYTNKNHLISVSMSCQACPETHTWTHLLWAKELILVLYFMCTGMGWFNKTADGAILAAPAQICSSFPSIQAMASYTDRALFWLKQLSKGCMTASTNTRRWQVGTLSLIIYLMSLKISMNLICIWDHCIEEPV